MPAPVKKQMRKTNAFGLWLTKKGRGLYYKKYHERYEGDLPEHKEKLSAIWHDLSNEEREWWKDEAKRQNESGEYRKYAEDRDQQRRRDMATRPLDETIANTNQHNERVERERRQKVEKINYVKKLSPYAQAMNLEHFLSVRERQREGLIRTRIDYSMMSSKFPSASTRYGNVMYLLTVFPYADIKFETTISVHPAEMTLIKWSPDSGIISTHTWNINFEPDKYFRDTHEGDVPDWAWPNIEENVARLNRSKTWIKDIEGGSTVESTWDELKEEIFKNPFVLFDANQNNFIRPGLHWLALESKEGLLRFNEEYDFDTEIAPNLYTIQDYAIMINRIDGINKNPEVDAFIEDRFQRPGKPEDSSSYCRMHQSTATANAITGRLHCTLAHGVRILDAFFDLMRTLKINSASPEYFNKPTQRLNVEPMSPGYYYMNSIIPSSDELPLVAEKTANEAYKLVEHPMRAAAQEETARLPPRMIAALSTRNVTTEEDRDRPESSRNYNNAALLEVPEKDEFEDEEIAETFEQDCGSRYDPTYLPSSLRALLLSDNSSTQNGNSYKMKIEFPSYLRQHVNTRFRIISEEEWDRI